MADNFDIGGDDYEVLSPSFVVCAADPVGGGTDMGAGDREGVTLEWQVTAYQTCSASGLTAFLPTTRWPRSKSFSKTEAMNCPPN